MAVLKVVAEKSGWKPRQKFAAGTGAASGCWIITAPSRRWPRCTWMRATRSGSDKICTAIDMGSQVINPGAALNMVHGGVIEAMSQMLWEISIENGHAVQTNFNRYPAIRMAQAPPEIEVHFLTQQSSADRAGRTDAAAGFAGDCECDFHGDGKKNSVAADYEERIFVRISGPNVCISEP